MLTKDLAQLPSPTLAGAQEKPLFKEQQVIESLGHYLPAQAPLKDFIHNNTLHAFQHQPFFDGLQQAEAIFGYSVFLPLEEYRRRYASGAIREDVLQAVVRDSFPAHEQETWVHRMVHGQFPGSAAPRIGRLRAGWKAQFKIDLDAMVHPILFRLLCSYLDQGISIWQFPVTQKPLLEAIREMEHGAFSSFFRKPRARQLLADGVGLTALLQLLVGDDTLYEQYLFDQQFAHQGWSGMVATIEGNASSLLDTRAITLHDLLVLECLLEIDALDARFPKGWDSLATRLQEKPLPLFAPIPDTVLNRVLVAWQRAMEWSYYDDVVAGLKVVSENAAPTAPSFQSLFCVDDREFSLRTYLELADTNCQTFGTPGFFGIETYYQPEGGHFYEKVCPAPVTPKYLIKDLGHGQAKDDTHGKARPKDPHLHKASQSFHSGWIITQTIGFWSALRLAIDIFRPSTKPASSSSFGHMHKLAELTVEHKPAYANENGLQVGFRLEEMAERVARVLFSIGLVDGFAPIVYVVGHGSSSLNNPHYAAYDCGACSGRAGSVNSRAFCTMANHPGVRVLLGVKGIMIPDTTQFLGALHDTTADEIEFYDEATLNPTNQALHAHNITVFAGALDRNAKERSRRFLNINTKRSAKRIHTRVKQRSVSLFEPRPELNHATNTLCIVGRRALTKSLFLDRRAFLNSYDYRVDPDGTYLLNILKAAAPVCGGINLEYYFSRVDNNKLGAGTKLPHNVMGLIGVANGSDGDLRPGLPSQMIEVHDPLRLLLVVEQQPDFLLEVILRSTETYEWFEKEWVHLVAIVPETRALYVFKAGAFQPYQPISTGIGQALNLEQLVENHHENLPVLRIN